jgi:hypothetical protein
VTLLTVSTVKGAPGGSTLALLLSTVIATRLDRDRTCVLAECDLSGGDLAPRLGVPAIPGVASLALAARHGLTVDLLLSHTQASPWAPRLRVLPGIAGPEQGRALSWMLADLGRALADPSIVAVADLGRLRGDDHNAELRRLATANLLVTNDDVASLLHSRAAVESSGHAGTTLGIVLAGDRTRRASQVSVATGADVLGAVRFDPRALSLLLHPRRFTLGRSSIALRGARGLIRDAESIVSRFAGLEAPIEQPARSSVPAGREAGSPARRSVTGRMRRRAVLAG